MPPNIFSHRLLTAADFPLCVSIRNAVAIPDMEPQPFRQWVLDDVVTWATRWDQSSVVELDGTLVGFMGSMNWSTPPREAIVAPVTWPYLSSSVTGAAAADAIRWLLAGVTNQLLACVSAHGVTPRALSVYWPSAIGIPPTVFSDLGGRLGGEQTIAGRVVSQEVICDLAALRVALAARGIT